MSTLQNFKHIAKKIGKFIAISYGIYFTIAVIWYFMPVSVVFPVMKSLYPNVNLNFELPTYEEFPKSTFVPLDPTDDDYAFIGAILENKDTIQQLYNKRNELTVYTNEEKKKINLCAIEPLTGKNESVGGGLNPSQLSKTPYIIDGVNISKMRALQEGYSLDYSLDPELYFDCKKRLEDGFHKEFENFLTNLQSTENRSKRIALGKELLDSYLEAEKYGYESKSLTEFIVYARFTTLPHMLGDSSDSWDITVKNIERNLRLSRVLLGQKSSILRYHGSLIIKSEFNRIYFLGMMQPESKEKLKTLLPLFEQSFFTKEGLKNLLIQSVEEEINITQGAPWYLHVLKIADTPTSEAISLASGSYLLQKYGLAGLDSTANSGFFDPVVVYEIFPHLITERYVFPLEEGIWYEIATALDIEYISTRRNALGVNSSSEKDTILKQYHFVSDTEKQIIEFLKSE